MHMDVNIDSKVDNICAFGDELDGNNWLGGTDTVYLKGGDVIDMQNEG